MGFVEMKLYNDYKFEKSLMLMSLKFKKVNDRCLVLDPNAFIKGWKIPYLMFISKKCL